MKIIQLIIIISLSVVLFSCNNDVKSETKESKTALRIISLVPSFSQEIIELGLGDNIVGATSYCEISKNNPDLIVGSVIDINEEKILLLKPDIVFASTLVKEKSIKILTNNGINVIFFDMSNSFEKICDDMIDMGEMLNRKTIAEEYVNKAKFRLDSIRKQIPKYEVRPRVFFQLGANPVAAVIPKTYMQDFIDYANCENIFYDLNKIIVSRESVVLRNPDYIIMCLMGDVANMETKEWLKYSSIGAAVNNNIFTLPNATTPTVGNFVDNFEIMVNSIYFKK